MNYLVIGESYYTASSASISDNVISSKYALTCVMNGQQSSRVKQLWQTIISIYFKPWRGADIHKTASERGYWVCHFLITLKLTLPDWECLNLCTKWLIMGISSPKMHTQDISLTETAAGGTEPASTDSPPTRLHWYLNENDTIMMLSLSGGNL